jgi:hypothetical protein
MIPGMNYTTHHNDQPAILKAIKLILANPASIKRKVLSLKEKYMQCAANDLHEHANRDRIADKLISIYSTKAGLSGGATALIGVVPGLGTAIKIFGGATTDLALMLKFQIELTMALADLYGQDIESEEDKKKYFIIAGLSTINLEAVKQGGDQASRLFTKVVKRYLQEATFDSVRILFNKVSITLSKKTLQKAIPLGIGALIGFSSNKTLTWMVGQRVKAFFASTTAPQVFITPYKETEEKDT